MAAGTTIHIVHGSENGQTITDEILKNTSSPRIAITALRNLLTAVVGGARNASLAVSVDSTAPVKASATITCATAIATNTITIGPQTLTLVNSGATTDEINKGGNNTLTAAAIAAAINAHAVTSKYVVASSALAVVTVTALQRGTMGNGITLASSGSTLAVSGAALSGGVGQDQAFVTYSAGV